MVSHQLLLFIYFYVRGYHRVATTADFRALGTPSSRLPPPPTMSFIALHTHPTSRVLVPLYLLYLTHTHEGPCTLHSQVTTYQSTMNNLQPPVPKPIMIKIQLLARPGSTPKTRIDTYNLQKQNATSNFTATDIIH